MSKGKPEAAHRFDWGNKNPSPRSGRHASMTQTVSSGARRRIFLLCVRERFYPFSARIFFALEMRTLSVKMSTAFCRSGRFGKEGAMRMLESLGSLP